MGEPTEQACGCFPGQAGAAPSVDKPLRMGSTKHFLASRKKRGVTASRSLLWTRPIAEARSMLWEIGPEKNPLGERLRGSTGENRPLGHIFMGLRPVLSEALGQELEGAWR